MEWLTHPSQTEDMEVEIGFLPQMELVSAAPSQMLPPGVNKKDQFISATGMLETSKCCFIENSLFLNYRASVGNLCKFFFTDNPDPPFQWTDHISMKQARRALEKRFYPFKEVNTIILYENF